MLKPTVGIELHDIWSQYLILRHEWNRWRDGSDVEEIHDQDHFGKRLLESEFAALETRQS
jgi:hypothetical protein